jgi:serine/threonine protein phosphatase PrpC/CRP-like cAMP-binding protein
MSGTRKLSRISADEMAGLNLALMGIFGTWAPDGEIDDANLQALSKACGWMEPSCNPGDISMIFASTKLGKKKTLKFERFQEACRKIATKKGITYQELVQIANDANPGQAPSAVVNKETGEVFVPTKVDNGDGTVTVTLQSLKMTYACLSQRGYYPDSPDKPNQDAFHAHAPFDNNSDVALFGVFDGHGEFGHTVAHAARDNIPVEFKNRYTADCDIQSTLTKTFTAVNEACHKNGRIDDAFSGTTAISVVFKNGCLEIGNAGDSRAIVAVQEDGKLLARPLSIDQTPYRKDERDRCRKTGARILNMAMLDGLMEEHDDWGLALGEDLDEEGDPPRIWAADDEYPGCAFTRSIGDMVAERWGVIAEPELDTYVLGENDRYVILASDGVWEFITSQTVVNMVEKAPTIVRACESIVQESYQLWLQYEERTDDITIIIVRIDELTIESQAARESSAPRKTEDQRPVRDVLATTKRSTDMRSALEDTTDEVDFNWADHATKKTPEEEEALQNACVGMSYFEQLNEAQRFQAFAVMQKKSAKVGEYVITQGDIGEEFFVVIGGKYEVRVQQAGQDKSQAATVHTYSDGSYFGELALMFAKPRAASIVCIEPGELWVLQKLPFRAILMRRPPKLITALKQALMDVDVLKTLESVQIERLIEVMGRKTYEDGAQVIKQGDVGTYFYIIYEGEAKAAIDDGAGNEKVVLNYAQFGSFGERALLHDAPRAASVYAVGRTKCLYIHRKVFTEVVLAPWKDALNASVAATSAAAAAPAAPAAPQLQHPHPQPQRRQPQHPHLHLHLHPHPHPHPQHLAPSSPLPSCRQ